jgi:hypothetical protein
MELLLSFILEKPPMINPAGKLPGMGKIDPSRARLHDEDLNLSAPSTVTRR